MTRRGVALSLAVFMCTAASARPEAVAIDHKAVGCIVVGKYPKMNACFSPAGELARSRVYFRPEGVQSWYYVEMKSDQPCFTGTLPRPGKKLVGKKIEYYVEAQNKAFEPARTAEFDPIVVKSAQECKKNVPVAPFLNNATVAVFPALPAGFVGGGLGTAAIVGIAGAGAAAAGTAAVVASNNNDTTTTTLAVVINTTTTTTTTLAPTTTTTTTLPSTNHAPFAVLTVSPDPPSGQGPLTVTFDLCKSTDPDKDGLSFFFDFGDGAKASGSCIESHTYQANFLGTGNVREQDRSYSAEACVVDPGNLSSCRSRTVNVTSPPPPPPPTPTFTVTVRKSGSGSGTVTDSTGQINCGGACTGTYLSGATVTLTASPAAGSSFGTWGGDCASAGTSPTCTLAVTANKSVTANFVLGPFILTVTKVSVSGGTGTVTDDMGKITCDPACPSASASYTAGTAVTLTATAAPVSCNSFTGWSGDIPASCIFVAGPPPKSCTVVMDANKNVGAAFTITPCFAGTEPLGTRSLTALAQLTGEEAIGSVIANGTLVQATAGSPLLLNFEARGGSNQVQARLDRSAKNVTWRFEFPDGSNVVPGSLHVVAGDVILSTPQSIVFRLEGKKGETVAFTFQTR